MNPDSRGFGKVTLWQHSRHHRVHQATGVRAHQVPGTNLRLGLPVLTQRERIKLGGAMTIRFC